MNSKKGSTGRALAASRSMDEGLHVVQVALQRLAAGGGEAVLRARHAAVEGLGAGDVAGVLELARVHAEVAVRGLEQPLKVVEGERIVDGERTDDPQPDALVDQPVQLRR